MGKSGYGKSGPNLTGLERKEIIDVYAGHTERASYTKPEDLKFSFARAALDVINVQFSADRASAKLRDQGVAASYKAQLNERLSITEAYARRLNDEQPDFDVREVEHVLATEFARAMTEDETRFQELSRKTFENLTSKKTETTNAPTA